MSIVDVIVPCYNYSHYLRRCVESVLAQSHSDLRVLIIDDASPDRTADVAAELMAQDGRVHFLRHRTNLRHIATYNEGLEWASGDYLVLLSADDLLTPGSLARSVRLLDAHPEVGLAYGRAIVFQSDESPPRCRTASEECGWKIRAGAEFLEAFCTSLNNLVWTPAAAIVRTELQKKLGGYREELPHSGDMEMWMRFAVHADVGALDAEQGYYRKHTANMSSGWYETPLKELKQRKAAFDVLFREQGGSIADRGRLQLMVDGKLSRDAFWIASDLFEKGDAVGCQEWLDFALEARPELRDQPEYARLRWKRRVGPRVWSALSPVVDYVRSRHVQCSKGL